jgi:hypothetical protein
MSRGLGEFQRLVLGAVREPKSAVSAGRLCWDIAERKGAVDLGPELGPGVRKGTLQRTYYKEFRRAFAALIARGEIRLTSRNLISPEDIVEHYPYKTLKNEVRTVRHQVLPELVTIATSNSFDSAEIESRLLQKMSPSDLAEYQARWAEMENVFWRVGNDPSARMLIIGLVMAGRRCFQLGGELAYQLRASSGGALSSWIKSVEGHLDPATMTSLDDLYCSAFPLEGQRQLNTKGWLFSLVDFSRRTVPDVNRETLERLLQRMPDLVTGLPGFARGRVARRGLLEEDRPTEFPSLLRRLFDRNIFEPVEFVVAV